LIYLDTSLLVAALCSEAKSPSVHAWLDGVHQLPLITSSWTLTEVASAVMLKQRMGHLDQAETANVFERWSIMQAASLHRETVDNDDFAEAAMLIRECSTALRSGDALHLAVAIRIGASVATLDRGLRIAASFFGTEAHEI
jgi:uncharacterized protein